MTKMTNKSARTRAKRAQAQSQAPKRLKKPIKGEIHIFAGYDETHKHFVAIEADGDLIALRSFDTKDEADSLVLQLSQIGPSSSLWLEDTKPLPQYSGYNPR